MESKRTEMGREYWIAMRMDEWLAVGMTMKEMREEMNLTIRDMAKSLGVSIARLKRFENGEPVRDSKLLYSAYILKIYGDNTYRNYCNLYNYTQGIHQFYPTLESTIPADK